MPHGTQALPVLPIDPPALGRDVLDSERLSSLLEHAQLSRTGPGADRWEAGGDSAYEVPLRWPRPLLLVVALTSRMTTWSYL